MQLCEASFLVIVPNSLPFPYDLKRVKYDVIHIYLIPIFFLLKTLHFKGN